MSLNRTLERTPGIVARRIAEETILVPVRRRAQEMGLFTLNEVGTFVWERLDGASTLREIASGIAEEFAVDAERADADLVAFAELLMRAECAHEVGR